ncbi:MAG: SAM-dependent methyltransferase [Lachnospiraceae bacterium]|nr:SAM-dependent methyltransferase [Lachnospiraceae bacterium]
MQNVIALLNEQLNERLNQIVLSGARDQQGILKVKIRPVFIGGGLHFQLTSYIGTKVYHENLTKEDTILKIEGLLAEQMKQMQLSSSDVNASALVSKKGTVTLKIKHISHLKADEAAKETGGHTGGNGGEKGGGFVLDDSERLAHNRKKRYLLPEGEAVPFLVDLGVQTPEGKIVKSKYDKFRQINRFLEFIEDVSEKLPKDRTVTIIDFGCGKSYLTFAMYYYLKIKKHYDIDVIGLDLKADVISSCNRLTQKYGYEHLRFLQGDIKDYEEKEQADMVVTLHACDTATDYALLKAVKWNAQIILSVPCCQHEVNRQIQNELLEPLLKYGILKERMSALITDGIRANLLEELGYQTQLLEFIDMENTPKNILIRAVKSGKMKKRSAQDIGSLLDRLHTTQSLYTLLQEEHLLQK